MLPFFFIPNKNTLFLLYTMLKATYLNNTYTFYVTLKDAQQQITSATIPYVNQSYLFKFTNDMSGAVKYAYAQNTSVNDRYAKLEIYNSTILEENVYTGKVNFNPNGYWKYEIYFMYKSVKQVSEVDCDLFNPLELGTWNCVNSSNDSLDTGDLNVDSYEITELVADAYKINEYSTCRPFPFVTNTPNEVNQITQTLTKEVCPSTRILLFTKVVRNIDTASFHITSNAPINSEIRFTSANRTYSHKVKALPEDVVMTVQTGTGVTDSLSYTVGVYASNVLQQSFNNVIAVRKPQQFRGGYIMASNNEWETSCGFGITLGSIFFTWNKTGNSPNGGYITQYEAPIEIGKLLIEEPQGDEQVRYVEHDSPNDTNYIYNE